MAIVFRMHHAATHTKSKVNLVPPRLSFLFYYTMHSPSSIYAVHRTRTLCACTVLLACLFEHVQPHFHCHLYNTSAVTLFCCCFLSIQNNNTRFTCHSCAAIIVPSCTEYLAPLSIQDGECRHRTYIVRVGSWNENGYGHSSMIYVYL